MVEGRTDCCWRGVEGNKGGGHVVRGYWRVLLFGVGISLFGRIVAPLPGITLITQPLFIPLPPYPCLIPPFIIPIIPISSTTINLPITLSVLLPTDHDIMPTDDKGIPPQTEFLVGRGDVFLLGRRGRGKRKRGVGVEEGLHD